MAKLLQLAQVAIPALAAIIELVLLALSADLMTFTKAYVDENRDAWQNNHARFHYSATLGGGYANAHNMPYTRPALLAALGVGCLLLNAAIVASLMKRRQVMTASSGKRV